MRYQTYGFTISALAHVIGIFFIMTFCRFMPLETKPLLIDFTTFTVKKTASETAQTVLSVRQATPVPLPAKPVIKENFPVATIQPAKRKNTLINMKPEALAEIVETAPVPPEPSPAAVAVLEESMPSKPPSATVAAVDENIPAAVARETVVSQDPSPDATVESDSLHRQDYVKAHFLYIKDDIQKNISYPPLARKMGWEGKVVVSFVVCENGTVVNIRIVESSGVALLDKNAVETIKKAVPFPNPPVKAELVVPICYKLG